MRRGRSRRSCTTVSSAFISTRMLANSVVVAGPTMGTQTGVAAAAAGSIRPGVGSGGEGKCNCRSKVRKKWRVLRAGPAGRNNSNPLERDAHGSALFASSRADADSRAPDAPASEPGLAMEFVEHARHRFHHRQPAVHHQWFVDAPADEEDDELAIEGCGDAFATDHAPTAPVRPGRLPDCQRRSDATLTARISPPPARPIRCPGPACRAPRGGRCRA